MKCNVHKVQIITDRGIVQITREAFDALIKQIYDDIPFEFEYEEISPIQRTVMTEGAWVLCNHDIYNG